MSPERSTVDADTVGSNAVGSNAVGLGTVESDGLESGTVGSGTVGSDTLQSDPLESGNRQHDTRQAVFDAFARLFARENYADITVQQIIGAAHIGRSTFYDHYRSKEALLDDLCAEMFQHIAANDPRTLEDHGFAQTRGELMPVLAHLLFHLREDNARLRGLLIGESAGLFLRKIVPYLRELIRANLNVAEWSERFPGTPEDFIVNHLVGSFNAAVTWWISQDFRQSPIVVAQYLEAMLPDEIVRAQHPR